MSVFIVWLIIPYDSYILLQIFYALFNTKNRLLIITCFQQKIPYQLFFFLNANTFINTNVTGTPITAAIAYASTGAP